MTANQPTNTTEHRLLVCSVGGTKDPLVKSVQHWNPEKIIFLASSEAENTINNVIAQLNGSGVPLSPGQYTIHIVEDPQDMTACIKQFRRLTTEVNKWINRGDEYATIVDITAGTKCMSAALALVSRRWGCTYSYIGGSKRTKGGIGVVETGNEQIHHRENPSNSLGYQAIEDAVTVFNHGGYAAAAELLKVARQSASDDAVKREISTVKLLVDAYAAWDRFDHTKAYKHFKNTLRNQNDLTAVFGEAQTLLSRLRKHRDHVHELSSNEQTHQWVIDLLHNAQRRAAEQRYDDAVARLYRAIEALAQIRLRHHHDISDTKNVPTEKIPPTLIHWKQRADESKKTIMVGLRDAYTLLRELNDDLGQSFFESTSLPGDNSPLSSRNQSILAHGFQTITEKVYQKLEKELLKLAGSQSNQTDPLDWRLPNPV